MSRSARKEARKRAKVAKQLRADRYRLSDAQPALAGFRGVGGGLVSMPFEPPLWRGTTSQVCGLFPFSVGSAIPAIGVPVGRHLGSQSTICCDPISWFQQANIISNPSAFLLSLPGLGKSTLIKRMITGLAAFGVLPMVLGDLKPDYVKLVAALDGQVLTVGPGRSYLNPLDNTEAIKAAARLTGSARKALLADSVSRQVTMVSALISIARKSSPTDREENILDRAVRLVNDKIRDRQPLLSDVLAVIQQAPEELRTVALDRGRIERYREITEEIEASLIGLVSGGRLGNVFSQPTSEPMDRTRPVVFDLSAISDDQPELRAATLLTCWSYGFASISAANTLSVAGLEPTRHRFAIMDEMWRILRAGPDMVDRIDRLTRINRTVGLGQIMCTHTMKDLLALSTVAEQEKARGFVERAGMVLCGGLPASEMPLLNTAITLSVAEQRLLNSWTDPAPWDSRAGREAPPPGRGNFLIKVGAKPGIPFHVDLVEDEVWVTDTNEMWRDQSRIGAGGGQS